MLKFGLEIDFGMTQKRYAAIFEIVCNFPWDQSSHFRYFNKILLVIFSFIKISFTLLENVMRKSDFYQPQASII